MLRTGILGLTALTMIAGQAFAAPASVTTAGTNRNQMALAIGGLPTPALRACATKPTDVRVQCALGPNNQLADENDDTGGGAGAAGYVIGAGALAAVTLGVLAGVDDDDDPVDVAPTPISS